MYLFSSFVLRDSQISRQYQVLSYSFVLFIQGTVRFLSYLAENSLSVDEGSWKLGIAILSVCQNILVCHGTRDLYVGKGLLFVSNGFRIFWSPGSLSFLYLLKG